MSKFIQKCTCTLLAPYHLSADSYSRLTLLYEPLIGTKAMKLYQELVAMGTRQRMWSLEDLLAFLGLNESQFKTERQHLEEYGLLVTWSNPLQSTFEFHLSPPMEAEAFFRDEVYGRMFQHVCGSARFGQLQKFLSGSTSPERLSNISRQLSTEALEEKWDEKKELSFLQNRPASTDLEKYPFDWDEFYKGMNHVFPMRIRTIENRIRIARMANFYGISENDMQKHVFRSLRNNRTMIDFDDLQKRAESATKRDLPKQARNLPKQQIAPLLYLQEKTGSPLAVPQTEKEVITKLMETYHFSHEVINTLIDYVFQKCHNQFPPKYVYSVAASWKREKIQTAAQAKEYIQKVESRTRYGNTPVSQGAPLPKWYSDTGKDAVEDKELTEKAKQVLEEFMNKGGNK